MFAHIYGTLSSLIRVESLHPRNQSINRSRFGLYGRLAFRRCDYKLELIGQIPNNPVIFVKGEDGFSYGVHIIEFPVKNLNAPV